MRSSSRFKDARAAKIREEAAAKITKRRQKSAAKKAKPAAIAEFERLFSRPEQPPK